MEIATTAPAQPLQSPAFNTVFENYQGPPFALRLCDGRQWSSSACREPVCTFALRSQQALETLLAAPNEISLGEAFIHGGFDVEGDLVASFSVGEHLFDRPRSLRRHWAEKLQAAALGLRRLSHGRRHSLPRDRASIAYHYDQPVAFFEPWLGKSLVYSCAYFHTPEDSLDLAQEQKLALVCRKLGLRPAERFLDIGCGWGSLVLYAALRHGASAHGITLSREQNEFASRRIQQAGLARTSAVALCDYRELEKAAQPFDKIASIGMFEHVGLRNLPRYFGIVQRLLRPGGLFLNHGIARSCLAPVRHSSFVEKFVFPDGRLVTLSQALSAAESAGFEVRDVENLREHYVLTLERWLHGLQQNRHALLRQVPEITYRIWLLYLAGSAAAFRRGDIGVYQILLSRPDHGLSNLPLTRKDWYSTNHSTGSTKL